VGTEEGPEQNRADNKRHLRKTRCRF